MINLALKPIFKPLLKNNIHLQLKSMHKLESVRIFTMPTKIKDRDINAMFSGLLALLKEKVQQEQSEKYLHLKLKYSRLKYLYNKIKIQQFKTK